MSIGLYKNPYNNQYVAPRGYEFYRNGEYIGRIAWIDRPDGYYVDKDEED